MPLWGDDPKDALIASQRDEIAYLRQKVDDLQKELLALTSTSAYRLVHKDEPEPPGEPPPLSPIQLRNSVASKDDLRTAAEIAASWPSSGEPTRSGGD